MPGIFFSSQEILLHVSRVGVWCVFFLNREAKRSKYKGTLIQLFLGKK
uniref:Uncharacterized protein n=1 Tax=Anguilla anguilla TaxID=7936 RepID=A0A0E9W682_ANGAN